ncbi:hypothetical protein [Xenorhabdus stockiae]|uniref:hypothetical protein n=1 Tax=Xenorhabdus stockiae TaxID=351614 RepID=UPI0040646764
MNAYEIETIEHTRQDDYLNHIDLPDNTPLSKIAMLGSHDAGTYAYSKRRNKNRIPRNLGEAFPGAFKTQNKSLVEQAEAGVRYFDIRVAQNKDNSFGFFHGPSVASGDAVDDVRELLKYAKEDPDNFYLIKFVFKGESKKNTTSENNAASDDFLNQVLEGYRDNIITTSGTPNLGKASVGLLNERKNIGIMVHGYNGTKKNLLYSYKDEVHTKWANRANAKATADSIKNFQSKEDKLNIIQTNMPFASFKHGEVTRGIKKYLYKNHTDLTDAVNGLSDAGIISADYIGCSDNGTSKFLEIINSKNQQLMPQ